MSKTSSDVDLVFGVSKVRDYVVTSLSCEVFRGGRNRRIYRLKCPCGFEFDGLLSDVRMGRRKCPSCSKHGRKQNLTGKMFGRLRATEIVQDKGSLSVWRLTCTQCSCVFERDVHALKLLKHCPCAQSSVNRTHGGSDSPAYRSWKSMIGRCSKPNRNYRDRGIRVVQRWHEFANFLADMGERPAGFTIDRIDPNGPYSLENCRWADAVTQSRNKRTNRWLSFAGETHTVVGWAHKTGLKPVTLKARLRAGWSVERALTEPLHPR